MRDEPPAKFREIYQLLVAAGIEFILVGGGAANLLGSARFTLDVDVVYRRDTANMQKIVDALRPIRPYLRGAPPGLPFELDLRTLRNGLNFTFTTSGLSTKTPEPLSQLGRSNIFYPAGAV